MSDDQPLGPADARSAVAGEYVLGSLPAAERAAFEQALVGDAGLRAEVYAWQDRLLGLAVRAAPAEPDARLWPKIESRLVAPLAPSAAASAAPDAANDPSWRQRLRRWQFASGVALAASVVLATLLVLRAPQPEAARYLALLQAPGDNSTGWVVEAQAGGMLRLVPIGNGGAPVPSGKSLQFWTKAEGAAGPTSLGLVTTGHVTTLPVDRLPTLGPRQLFELTLEPEAGSPIGRPTGPILYVGRSMPM